MVGKSIFQLNTKNYKVSSSNPQLTRAYSIHKLVSLWLTIDSIRLVQTRVDSIQNFGLECNPSKLEPFQVIPNHNEKLFISLLMKIGQKLIRLNPRHQFAPGLIQTESFWPRIHSDLKFGLDQSELGWIRIGSLVWIHSDWCFGI